MTFPKIFVVLVINLTVANCLNTSSCIFNGGPFLRAGAAYVCRNYHSLPQNLPRAGKTSILHMQEGTNTLEVLKSGAIQSTGMVHLSQLRLNKCGVEKIELGAFKGTKFLNLIELNFNKIETLDLKVFEDVPRLETLTLQGNLLSIFGYQWFPNMRLKNLNLGSCRIAEIREYLFKHLTSLEKLLLDKNELETVEWNVFRGLKNLTLVWLQGNPWHCDCQVRFLLDYLDYYDVVWQVPDMIPECNTEVNNFGGGGNGSLVGVKWTQIKRELLMCPPRYHVLGCDHDAYTGLVEFRCQYSGYPEPNVTWKKNDVPLKTPNVEKEVIKSDGPGFAFEFWQYLTVRYDKSVDGSVYACHLRNTVGDGASKIRFGTDQENILPDELHPFTFPSVARRTSTKVVTRQPVTSPKVHLNGTRVPHTTAYQENNNVTQISSTPVSTTSSFGTKDESDLKFYIVVAIIILIIVGIIFVSVGMCLIYVIRRLRKRPDLPKGIYRQIPKQEKQTGSGAANANDLSSPNAQEEPRYYDYPHLPTGSNSGQLQQAFQQELQQHIYEGLGNADGSTSHDLYYLTPISLQRPRNASRTTSVDETMIYHADNPTLNNKFKQ